MTLIYFVYDAEGEVLYIGHTKNLHARRKCHKSTASWFPRAAHWEVVGEYASKAEALSVERDYIADLEPECNIQGNPGQMTWDEFVAWSGILEAVA